MDQPNQRIQNLKAKFESKKWEIELGIRNLLDNVLGEELQSEVSHTTSEISKVYELDKLMRLQSEANIWACLENIDLSRKDAFFYLGLVMDYDTILIEEFVKVTKSILEKLEINYRNLIDILRDCSFIKASKIITFFALIEKADKDQLSQADIMQIICIFENRLPQLYLSDEFTDLLIRRFSQFLNLTTEWNMGGLQKLKMKFWNSLLSKNITAKTFKYMLPALKNHIKLGKNKKAIKSEELITNINLRKKEMDIHIGDEFFCTHKDWVSANINFYLNYILQDEISFEKKKKILEIDVKDSINTFLSYIKNKNRKRTRYIIETSKLIRIFDFSPLSENILRSINKLIDAQLTSQCYSMDFLKRYFSDIKHVPSDNVLIAENIATQFMLFSSLDKDSDSEMVKSDIIDYAVDFFRYHYNAIENIAEASHIISILSPMLWYLPQIWDRINQVNSEFDEIIKQSGPKPIVTYLRAYFWECIKLERNHEINGDTPGEFERFIYNLVNYLRKGDDTYHKAMSDIVSTWNNGFHPNSAKYEDNEYWGQVLIYFFWNSENLSDLREYWKNEEENKKKEEDKKEETKEVAKLLITTSDESSIVQNELAPKISKENKIEQRKNTCDSDIELSFVGNVDLFGDTLADTPPVINEPHKDNCVSLNSQPINESQEEQKGDLQEEKKGDLQEEHKVSEEIKENINALENRIPKIWTKIETEFQAALFEKLKSSFIIKILFGIQTPVQVKKWIISQLVKLLTLSVKKDDFIMKTVSVVVQLISKPITKPDDDQMAIFQELGNANIVKEGLRELKLIIDERENYYEYVYFANLPINIAGVTVFGGDILINSNYNDYEPLKKCAQKIIFIHELPHHIRTTKNGFYDIYQKTPPFKIGNKKEAAGALKEKSLPYTNEVGLILESVIFPIFFMKICEEQINFLNNVENWNRPINNFKDRLKSLYSRTSNQYQMGRSKGGLHSLQRRGHNEDY